MLIKTSAKFVSIYNLLEVFCYLDHFFSESFKIQVLTFEANCLFIFTLFQTVQRHGVYIAAYDRQLLLLLLYYLVRICRKMTVIYRYLENNHLIQLLWVFFIHVKLEITSATLGSKT